MICKLACYATASYDFQSKVNYYKIKLRAKQQRMSQRIGPRMRRKVTCPSDYEDGRLKSVYTVTLKL